MTDYAVHSFPSLMSASRKRPLPELPRMTQLPQYAAAPVATMPTWTNRMPVYDSPQEKRVRMTNLLSTDNSNSNSNAYQAEAPRVAALPSMRDILARANPVPRQSAMTSRPVEEAVAAEPVSYSAYTRPHASYNMESQYYMPATNHPMMAREQVISPTKSSTSSSSPVSSQNDANKRRERWTEDEHARFMEGLNRYGRKWKKIQTFVKTKTAVQVRTHAYGYFAKLLRNMPEDDAIWEMAEEVSSLPGAVLKGPGNGKRRNEPKTDEEGMEVLRRFVFNKKRPEDVKRAPSAIDTQNTNEEARSNAPSIQSLLHSSKGVSDISPRFHRSLERPNLPEYPVGAWTSSSNWNTTDTAATSAILELKKERLA
ncbi:TPA: hypothetical protein N0F65_008225 [Lagenidium giganteum]|uniref:Uncharacterized protein n=1 Tax=Lagenidium giganteum TaxID=4803 RepID=A0AAV2Z1D1_9STRA|nr:TPA: hypothetical protein N0F65_008225 [Lagenidium giganteum]